MQLMKKQLKLYYFDECNQFRIIYSNFVDVSIASNLFLITIIQGYSEGSASIKKICQGNWNNFFKAANQINYSQGY